MSGTTIPKYIIDRMFLFSLTEGIINLDFVLVFGNGSKGLIMIMVSY